MVHPCRGSWRSVLLLPPSMEALEARLRARETDTDEAIVRRMGAARHELSQFESFDYAIVNDDLEAAYTNLKALYQALRLAVDYQRALLRRLLDA